MLLAWFSSLGEQQARGCDQSPEMESPAESFTSCKLQMGDLNVLLCFIMLLIHCWRLFLTVLVAPTMTGMMATYLHFFMVL